MQSPHGIQQLASHHLATFTRVLAAVALGDMYRVELFSLLRAPASRVLPLHVGLGVDNVMLTFFPARVLLARLGLHGQAGTVQHQLPCLLIQNHLRRTYCFWLWL